MSPAWEVIRESHCHPIYPLIKDNEQRLTRLRTRLEDMLGEIHLVRDVITVSIESMRAQVSDFDPEVGHVLYQCDAEKLYRQLKSLSNIIESLGDRTVFTEERQPTSENRTKGDEPCSHRLRTNSYEHAPSSNLSSMVSILKAVPSYPRTVSSNKIDVNRAPTVGVFALDQMMARLTRRAQLPESVGKPWTFEEEQQLREESVNGESGLPRI